jgi:MscS family membrane protein
MMDFTKLYYGNTIKQWAITFAIILVSIVLGKFFYWVSKNYLKKSAEKTQTKVDDILVDIIEEPFVFAITLLGIWIASKYITLTENISIWFSNGFEFLITITLAWFIVRLTDSFFKDYLAPLTKKTKSKLDETLLPVIRKGIKMLIWALAIIIALNNAGYNVGAILAGLGIGGLAFALAAKDLLANIFGGFNIFADKPFKINDIINISGKVGKVKEIGLRSTRIQTFEGRMLVIPNSKFTEGIIENISMEPSKKITLNLGLTYNTTPEKIQEAIKILKNIAQKHKDTEEKVLASFVNFGESSMDILFIYYIKKGGNTLDIKNSINTEILKQFNKHKIEFAFPTRTIFTKKD